MVRKLFERSNVKLKRMAFSDRRNFNKGMDFRKLCIIYVNYATIYGNKNTLIYVEVITVPYK